MKWLDAAPAGLHVGQVQLGAGAIETLTDGERALSEDLRGAKQRLEFLAGRAAARQALHSLLGAAAVNVETLRDSDGAPRLVGLSQPISISISHGLHRAVAAAGAFRRLGIDLVDLAHAPRLVELGPRYLGAELSLLSSPWAHAACWAAKEAGLKALRLGLLDGGVFGPGSGAIRVVSLDPPRLDPAGLSLALAEVAEGPVAVVWER